MVLQSIPANSVRKNLDVNFIWTDIVKQFTNQILRNAIRVHIQTAPEHSLRSKVWRVT